MARQTGLAFTGRVDGLSFYYDQLHGYLVRRTGGVTSKQFRTQERYAAARDASAEFAHVSRVGKLIRNALKPFMQPIKDSTMVNRLNKELVALKQLDNIHFRRERRPETMMTYSEANKYFRIFQFNDHVKTYELTAYFPTVLREQHILTMNIKGLLPQVFPEGATHAGLTLVQTVIDFEQDRFETRSSRMALVSRGGREELRLVIEEFPPCAGTELICLQVVFFREQDGDLVQLEGNVHSMGIVAVGSRKLTVSKDYVCRKKVVRMVEGAARKVMLFSRRKEVMIRGVRIRGDCMYNRGRRGDWWIG